jgi:hypothetical protein
MEPTPVRIKLANIHCQDEGDSIGSAEPYLWTVFFKIDGDTTYIDSGLHLHGTATVVTTPGNHGNLGVHEVTAGDDVPIPAELGEFSAVLKPIPLSFLPPEDMVTEPGWIGCVVILLEQDATPDHAVASGHEALNQAVQSALDALIPTLSYQNQSPTDDQIKALSDQVAKQVMDAISNDVSGWDQLKNQDDKIGSRVFYYSQSDICTALLAGIPLEEDWDNEGRWQISGTLGAVIDELEISCIHKPAGHAETHHIDELGGVFNDQAWKLRNTDVIRYIQSGTRFYVMAADGSRSQVEVQQHWISKPNPTGLYLTTVPDDSKADNLLSLPTCPS